MSRETSARAVPVRRFPALRCVRCVCYAAAPQRSRGLQYLRFSLAYVTQQGSAAQRRAPPRTGLALNRTAAQPPPPLLRRSGQNGRVANRCQRQAYPRYSRVLTALTVLTVLTDGPGLPSGAQPVSKSTAGPSGSVRLQVDYSQYSRSLALGGLPSAGAGPSRARRGMSHGQYS